MRLAPLLLVLALGAAAASALAQTMGFLNYSPVSYFNDEDWRVMQEAIRDAMENNPDGETRIWENPGTGHKGRITPLKTYQDFGTTCRRTRFFTEAGGTSGTSVFNLCKDAEQDAWKIAS